MFQLFEYGQIVLNTINKVGDWLMYTPETLTFYNPLMDQVVTINNNFGNIGSMIIGGGLVGILLFRLVKFFLDIIL